MTPLWHPADIKPGTVLRDVNGLLWEVVSWTDQPTVCVRTLNKTMPEREHHVVQSPLFAERFPEKLISMPLDPAHNTGESQESRPDS